MINVICDAMVSINIYPERRLLRSHRTPNPKDPPPCGHWRHPVA
jgi:hypothetical protein